MPSGYVRKNSQYDPLAFSIVRMLSDPQESDDGNAAEDAACGITDPADGTADPADGSADTADPEDDTADSAGGTAEPADDREIEKGSESEEQRILPKFDSFFSPKTNILGVNFAGFSPKIGNLGFSDVVPKISSLPNPFTAVSAQLESNLTARAMFAIPPGLSAKITGVDSIYSAITQMSDSISRPFFDALQGVAFAPLFQRVGSVLGSLGDVDLRRTNYPVNIADSDVPLDLPLLRSWIAEGLPILHVPGPETLTQVALASSAGERRAVYGRRWRGILNECEVLLDDATAVATVEMVAQARKAIAGIRAGYVDLAQAYAGAALDTIVKEEFPNEQYYKWVSGKKVQDPYTRPLHQALMLAQLQSLHTKYFPGDAVPGTFNRHGTAHAVGKGRQYSRLNAVLGVVHLTSLIWSLDVRFSRGISRSDV